MIAKIRGVAILAILAAALGLPLSSARAADPPRLSQLTIRLWPEYDKPGVLVFLTGQTAQGVALPAELKFVLPQGATVNAVAYLDTTRNVLTDQVPQSVDGQNVSITTPNGNFHIEFYDNSLKNDAGARTYSYTWQQAITVDRLTWQVEQPVGATGFKVEPAGGSLGTDENGLPAYQLDTATVAANQASAITVSYNKPDNTLTRDALAAAQPAATTAPDAGQPASSTTSSIIIAASILVLAVVVSAVMYFRGGFSGIGVRVVPQPGKVARQTGGKSGGKPGKKQPSGVRFCPQCGQPANPGDQFCRKCGTRLRT